MRYVLILCAILFALPAVAAENAQYRSWAAFSYEEAGAPTCYAVTRPESRKGAPKGAKEGFLYVTHRPSEKSLSVFQYVAGFELKLGSTAVLTIDGSQYTLFTTEGAAWARGNETDRAIAEAIRKGKTLSITATAEGGKSVTDKFSLAGSTLALQAIGKMCGV